MVKRRTILKSGIAFGTLGLASTALGQKPSSLVIHDFEGGAYPGGNDLDNWAGGGSFSNGGGSGTVSGSALRLEYNNAGWFASNVSQSITDHQHLAFRVRGDSGGEASHFRLSIGGIDDLLSNLTDDTIGTDWSIVSVDLGASGVSLGNPQAVRMNFWQGHSGAIEIDRIAFTTGSETGAGTGTPTPTPMETPDEPTDTPEEPTDTPEETPTADDQLPSTITADTSIAELCPRYKDPYYVPRDFLDYLPGESSSGRPESVMTDAEKAAKFNFDIEAVKNKVWDGTLTLGDLGTQALPIVQRLAEESFPAHATVKLLPRFALMPDKTEPLPLHNPPKSVWDEIAGQTVASNSPAQFTQDPWPTDARTYIPEEVAIRDRVHDQPLHEDWWGTAAPLPDDVLYDDSNPLLDAVSDKIHPVSGEPLGGNSFTATAPMAARVKMHILNPGYWYQYLEFENISRVPYHLDGAIIWWLGPSTKARNLADGHYNNAQRPNPSLGHPQRDVIEVIHDDYEGLSAFAVRLAFHDQPYNMRTAYPDQKWSLEIGTPPFVTDVTYSTHEERQQLLNTMLNSLHVELETNMDMNDDVVEAVDLKHRVPN